MNNWKQGQVSSDAPFQCELRQRQCRWREKMGYPIGSHNGKPLGSRLSMPEAEQNLWNFLTPAIGKLVQAEYEANKHQPRFEKKMYGYPRLFLVDIPVAFIGQC